MSHYCTSCRFWYNGEREWNEHFSTSDHAPKFCCTSCKIYFFNQKTLDQHVKAVHLPPHYCAECDRSFLNDQFLRQHNKLVHVPKCYCAECDRFFINEPALNQHLRGRVHASPEMASRVAASRLFCETCNRKFINKQAMTQHLASLSHNRRPRRGSRQASPAPRAPERPTLQVPDTSDSRRSSIASMDDGVSLATLDEHLPKRAETAKSPSVAGSNLRSLNLPSTPPPEEGESVKTPTAALHVEIPSTPEVTTTATFTPASSVRSHSADLKSMLEEVEGLYSSEMPENEFANSREREREREREPMLFHEETFPSASHDDSAPLEESIPVGGAALAPLIEGSAPVHDLVPAVELQDEVMSTQIVEDVLPVPKVREEEVEEGIEEAGPLEEAEELEAEELEAEELEAEEFRKAEVLEYKELAGVEEVEEVEEYEEYEEDEEVEEVEETEGVEEAEEDEEDEEVHEVIVPPAAEDTTLSIDVQDKPEDVFTIMSDRSPTPPAEVAKQAEMEDHAPALEIAAEAPDVIKKAIALEAVTPAVAVVAQEATPSPEVTLAVATQEPIPPPAAALAVVTREATPPPVVAPEEVVTPEVVTPEAITPEVIAPEVNTPEVITPEVITPEVITPEVATPEVVKPEVVKPEVVKPEVVTPEVVTPAAVAPDDIPPAAITPGIAATGSVAPESPFSKFVDSEFFGSEIPTRSAFDSPQQPKSVLPPFPTVSAIEPAAPTTVTTRVEVTSFEDLTRPKPCHIGIGRSLISAPAPTSTSQSITVSRNFPCPQCPPETTNLFETAEDLQKHIDSGAHPPPTPSTPGLSKKASKQTLDAPPQKGKFVKAVGKLFGGFGRKLRFGG